MNAAIDKVNIQEEPQEDIDELRMRVLDELQRQGFYSYLDSFRKELNKDDMRMLNMSSVMDMRSRYRKRLEKKEDRFLNFIADGSEINVKKIDVSLLLVDSRHKLWDLFNYIKVHWSIPISNGYGRRLSYLVFDNHNNKIIGIIGLGDPVFALGARDKHIGWTKKEKALNLNKLMDGFVIGAIPPYSLILGGKLVASMLFSTDIREDFREKYSGRIAYISERKNSGDLVAITTLSAFGKSSIYDRIRIPNGQKFISVGYSEGWGEFHFNGELYEKLQHLVLSVYGGETYKNEKWGGGIRNKREVVHKALRILELPRNLSRHGIEREVFLIPQAENYISSLKYGSPPKYYRWDVEKISTYMKNRWVIPRSERDKKYINWKREKYRIYR